MSRKIYIWKRANLNILRQTIQQNVENFLINNSLTTPINSLWTDFRSIVINAQEAHVPSKMSSVRYSQPWFTVDCKKAVRKKKKLYNKAKESNLKYRLGKIQGGSNSFEESLSTYLSYIYQ